MDKMPGVNEEGLGPTGTLPLTESEDFTLSDSDTSSNSGYESIDEYIADVLALTPTNAGQVASTDDTPKFTFDLPKPIIFSTTIPTTKNTPPSSSNDGSEHKKLKLSNTQ